MKSVFNLQRQRNLLQALGFYLCYLVLFILLSYAINAVAGTTMEEIVRSILGIILTVGVINGRKIETTGTMIGGIVVGGFLFYVSPFFGLLVPAYISTISPTRKFKQRMIERFVPMYNKRFRQKIQHPVAVHFPEAADVFKHQDREANDISDHLGTLFFESLKQNPKLIVELGVRTGESTKCLEKVAKICDSTLIQVDPDAKSYHSIWKKSFFVAEDDITFAKTFKKFCEEKKIQSTIDVLFIDTTHLYEQTVNEIRDWFPFLAPNAKVMFYRHRNGHFGQEKRRNV